MGLPRRITLAPTATLARRGVALAVVATAVFLLAALLGMTPLDWPGRILGSLLAAAGVGGALCALVAILRRGERSVAAFLMVFPYGPIATLFLMEFTRLME